MVGLKVVGSCICVVDESVVVVEEVYCLVCIGFDVGCIL